MNLMNAKQRRASKDRAARIADQSRANGGLSLVGDGPKLSRKDADFYKSCGIYIDPRQIRDEPVGKMLADGRYLGPDGQLYD